MTKTKQELQVSEKREVATPEGELTYAGRMYVPLVDIFEDENGIALRADVPGATRDDIDIDLRDGVLSVTARVERTPDNWRAVYREHQVGGFNRRFTLTKKVDQEGIKATVENGVLKVLLPKAQEHKPRRIEIR